MRQIARRLQALEAAAGQGLPNCARLLGLAQSGKLSVSDLDRLSDQQLWWIIAGENSPVPAEAELARMVIGDESQQPAR